MATIRADMIRQRSSLKDMLRSATVPGLCAFCDNPLDDSLEHILQSAIGGQKCSRRVICGDHNNQFGSTIDKVLAKQLAIFCNLLAIKTGRGEATATLKNLKTADGQRIDLTPGGKFVGKPNLVDIEVEPGKRQIQIRAGSEEELQHLATQYLKKYGKDLNTLDDVTIEQRIEPRVTLQLAGELGGEPALRAVAKVALLLLASEIGTDAVRSADTEAVRKFITQGGLTQDIVRHDYDTAFPSVPEHASLPEYAHRVSAIADPSTGMAIGLVELFGTFRYTVLLSEAWTGPAAAIHYGVDPTSGEDSETQTSTSLTLTGDMFRTLETPEPIIAERLKRLFSSIKKRQQALSFADIAQESMDRLFTPDRMGTILTEEDINQLANEVVGRFFAVHYRFPYAKKVELEQITRAAPKKRVSRRWGRQKKR